MNALRVLVLEPAGNLWGSERVLLDFLAVASRSPWQIGICCPPNTQILDALAKLPVRTFPIFVANLHQKKRSEYLRAVVGLLIASLRFKPDILYVNQAGATRIALIIARILRIPVVTHVRLVEDAQYILSLHADEKFLPKVICISQFIRSLFDRTELPSSGRLELLYDPYISQCNWNKPTSLVQSMDAARFSCVGRLAYSKGQDIALQAIAKLRDDGFQAQGIFLGTAAPGDEFDQQLIDLSVSLGLVNEISWLGYQSQVLAQIASCTALICPSRAEPLGRVIFEAWDAGTIPVVWAGSGGAAEVIQASGGGFLYDEQNGDSLSKTLKQVIMLTSSERQQIIQQGRSWLQAFCDTNMYTERMLNLWQGVLKEL